MSRLVITLVNWNGRDMLETCLESLKRQTFTDWSMILVDNGSTDGSVDYVKKHHPDITLIEFDHNTGFAHPHSVAINTAFEDSTVEYILTLNNDTEMDERFLEEMVAAAQRHPDAGSIQGKVVRLNDPEHIDCTGVLVHWDMSAMNRGQEERDAGQFAKEEEIFGPSASAALYRRSALERVALPNGDIFDSNYFAYYEDVDLAWRLRLAGFTSWYTPNAIIKHVHSATGVSHSPFKAFHIHRNHYYNMIKNLPPLFLLRALTFMPIRYLLLLSSVVRGKGASAHLAKNKERSESIIMIVLRSWKDIVLALPRLLAQRRQILKSRTASVQDVRSWFKRFPANLQEIIYGSRND